jgi:hypothetical protein
VALYVGEDSSTYHVIGGNQADCVCFTRIAKGRSGPRGGRPTGTAGSVKMCWLSTGGAISTNEADRARPRPFAAVRDAARAAAWPRRSVPTSCSSIAGWSRAVRGGRR